jgi:hypothetical protein
MGGINKMDGNDKYNLERFEFPIVAIALVLYVAERCLVFAFLQNRSGDAGVLESQVMGFFFGRPPYSILNLLLGFDLNQGFFGLIQPINLLRVISQAAHFLLNYWIVRLPLLLVTRLLKRKTDH